MPTPTVILGRPHALGDLLATVRLRVRALAWQTVAWVRARTPEQLLWVALGLVIFRLPGGAVDGVHGHRARRPLRTSRRPK